MLAFLGEMNRVGSTRCIEIVSNVRLTETIIRKQRRVVREGESQPRNSLPFESHARSAKSRHTGNMFVVIDVADTDAAAKRDAPTIADVPIVNHVEQGGTGRRPAAQNGLCDRCTTVARLGCDMTVKAKLEFGANARVPFITSRREVDHVAGVAHGNVGRWCGERTRVDRLKLVVAGAESEIPTGIVSQCGRA